MERVRVYLLGVQRGNHADLVIFASVLPPRVGDGVNVETGALGLSCELPESLHELLLQLVGDVVLLTEEDYAPA